MRVIRKLPRLVRDGLKALALFVMLLAPLCPAYAQLPPEVQADLLQDAIIEDIKGKNLAAARDNIAKYRALGVNVPPAIMMIDAKVAVALNEPLRAIKVLEDYFKKFGTKDSGYSKALELYKKIKRTAEKDRQAKARADKKDQQAKAMAIRKDRQVKAMAARKDQQAKAMASEFNLKKKAAEQGDAGNQSKLGNMYYFGQGVKKDDAEAAKWFRKAADQDQAYAQNRLGSFYSTGQGVKQDKAEAAKWFRKAAEQGHVWGQYNLGLSYNNGWGVKQDKAEAAKWFRKAAEQGNAMAKAKLGKM